MNRMQFRKMFILAVILIFTGSGIALAHDDWGQRGDRDDYHGHTQDYDGGYGGHMMDHDWHYGGHMRDYDGRYGGPMMGYDDGGYGGHMMDRDWGHHGYMMGPDYDSYGSVHHNLSRSEYRKLEKAREKFYHQTRELRVKMDNTRYAIQREMNKVAPDRHKIRVLRKELSALQAKFDHYSVEYDLAVHKGLPDSTQDRAYAGGFRGGYNW